MEGEEKQDLVVIVLQSCFFIVLIVTALIGNSFVILSVFRYKNLQIQENCYVVSLAIADLFIVIVMIFNACNQVVGEWFGPFMCNLFNSLDVYFSTISIFHLCCISVDRYYAVKKPLTYRMIMTRQVITGTLIAVWIVPISISFVPIFMGWHAYIFELDSDECEFKVNRTYSVISSSVSFWIPCVIMFYTYYQIFIEANKKEKQLVLQKRSFAMMRRGTTFDNSNETCNNVTLDDSENPTIDTEEESLNLKREYKAAKTLGITLGIFILCWTPFFIWYISTAFCGDTCLSTNKMIILILFWIGYANSIFNPIIYAYFNTNFRTAYIDTVKWVFMRKTTLNN